MLQRYSAFVGVVSLLVATPALAVSVIDKSQAVGVARTDPGSGVCGSITHFVSGAALTSKADAEVILNKPATDPAVLGRTARLFDNLNFRNGQTGTNGDFTLPNYRDEIFPYSTDIAATPMGNDLNNALRLRGYFNVPATLAGKIISFGLNCDDFCALRIGKMDLMPVANQVYSARVIAQVKFNEPGLYPIEMVHYQNGSAAYLEWSRSDVEIPECPSNICSISLSDAGKYMGAFKPLLDRELFSAKIGSNLSCQECGAPGMSCSVGNYCGDGLCQTCNLPDHCGPTCMACPTSANICSSGKCVECVADDQCPSGLNCDVPNGKCLPPQLCSSAKPCPGSQVCDLETNLCGMVEPCRTDDMCTGGQICAIGETGKGRCVAKPTMCNMNADCKEGYQCDTAAHLCTPLVTTVNGCTTAWVPEHRASPQRGGLAGLGVGLGAAALLLFRRAKKRSASAPS